MTLLLAENIMKYMCFLELEWTSEWHRFIQAHNYLRWFSSQLSQLHVWGKLLTTEVSSSLSGESCINSGQESYIIHYLSNSSSVDNNLVSCNPTRYPLAFTWESWILTLLFVHVMINPQNLCNNSTLNTIQCGVPRTFQWCLLKLSLYTYLNFVGVSG